MKLLLRWAATLSLALTMLAAPVAAQTVVLPQVKNTIGQFVPSVGAVAIDSTGVEKGTNANPIVSIGVQESFALVTSDVAVLSATVSGGDYAFSQICATYGSLTLQHLGPDKATWLTLASYTAADTGPGHPFSLPNYDTLRVVEAGGTSGCNAILARIPA